MLKKATSIPNDRAAWIRAGGAECSQPPAGLAKPHRFVLLGAPGVGKGTQAAFLHEMLGTCQLSTGDVFRSAPALCSGERSPALSEALGAMQRGELVSDETVLDLVRERARCLRCPGGFVLDGFPRTVGQARALDQLLAEQHVRLDAVLNYEMPLAEIVTRLSGRLTCAHCKAVFHATSRPPKRAGVCDLCGGSLLRRGDDRPATVSARLKAYELSTAPLADFYRQQKLLISVHAAGSPEEVFRRSIVALEACGVLGGRP